MIKKANIQWSAKQLTKSIQKGNIKFDHAVQRGYVWDQDRKSLLIHSLIEGYPVPAFYAVKDENSQYIMLDGRQRSGAISDFLNGEYELTNVPEINIGDEGETININGLKFSDLPEDARDEIESYSLTVYYFDSQITDDEINELFFRLNNGKPLTSIELSRVKAKSIETIQEIGKHELFKTTLTEKAINKYTNEEIVIKSWAMLNVEQPSFETKSIRPLIETADITPEQTEKIKIAYDRILETYNSIKQIDDKEHNKIAKRIITRTHLIALVPVAAKSVNDGIQVSEFTKWATSFFSGKKSASVSEVYNSAIGSGSAKPESIKKRNDSIMESYNEQFSN